MHCLHARIIPQGDVLICIGTVETLLVVDMPPCCRAGFGCVSILHIKATRKNYISIGILLNDVGVHWPSIALVVGHEWRKWGSTARWSASSASTTTSTTNGRQATLCALTPDIVGKWCAWVASAYECSARTHTTPVSAALSTCGTVRIERGEGRYVKSSNGQLLVAVLRWAVNAANYCCTVCWFTASCAMATVTAAEGLVAVVAIKLLCAVNAAICLMNNWTS